MKLANKYLEDGEYEEAELALLKVISVEPKNIEARIQLAKAYTAEKKYDKAEQTLKDAAAIDVNDPAPKEELAELYILQGKELLSAGRLKESKEKFDKAESELLSSKDLLSEDSFKNLYFNIKNSKAAALSNEGKYKEAAETYAECGKYNKSTVQNTDYINALSKYAESELIKKTNIAAESLSNLYSIGDIDNDGILEVAVFEKNFSLLLDTYTPNNIKLFKYFNDKYSLFSTVECTIDDCISINISKAKEDIYGIFVSGYSGAHMGNQFLYIIKEGKLISALNKDIISIYPSEIKDIDGDKILELSSLERDPKDPDSSNAECNKILTWYKWDGKDGLITVKT